MYQIGQVLFHTGNFPAHPVTRYTIEEKVKTVSADGAEQYLYRLSGFAVYFPERELIKRFSAFVEDNIKP